METAAERPVNWRLNLGALWVASFLAIAGFSFTSPFMPLFLSRELGVTSQRDVALWTGVIQGALGAGLFVASPVWGLVADRYGRKLMLLRAIFVGSLAVGLIGFARNPLDVTALRLLYGAAAATYPVAIAIVAMETPRAHVGWAVGVISSAVAVASAVGPALGSLGAAAVGLRAVFFLSSAMFLAASVPVVLLVRERRRPSTAAVGLTRQALARLGATPQTLRRAITVLLGAQILVSMMANTALILVVLKLLALSPPNLTVVTGLTFAASGVATAVAGVAYSSVARRFGYRRLVAAAAAGLVVLLASMAATSTIGVFVGLAVLFGLVNGVVTPAVAALLGMEAPDDIKGTIFGLNSSAGAVGMLLGPLLAGITAATLGPSGAFVVSAGLALGLAVVAAGLVREPPPEPAPVPA